MSTTIGRARCPLCGARLRERRQFGELCDPCEKLGPDPRRALPADFYHRPPIARMLATYDFGPYFIEVRRAADWTQQTLAGVIELTQSHISAIERGEHRLRDIETIATLARNLAIPPALLNFPDIRTTVSRQEDTEQQQEASWVHRRDFTQHVAGLVLGIAGAAGLDTARLLALLPQAEPAGTRHVGTADVEAIEQLTAAFVRQDYVYGSGPIRDAAVAQLGTVLPLLGAQVDPEVRARLMVATASLAVTAGWQSFEVLDHDAARRLWMIGLDVARATDHPLATDLTVFLLHDMALQAVHLGRPEEARHLARIGHTAAVGRHPVSATTTCTLGNAEALAHGALGDAAACDRALGQATEHVTTTGPATAPPWAYLDDTRLASLQGDAHYAPALTGQDQDAAGRGGAAAAPRRGPLQPRLRPPPSQFPHEAGRRPRAERGHRHRRHHRPPSRRRGDRGVLPRAHDRLRTLHTALKPLHNSPGVAELRDRLSTTVA